MHESTLSKVRIEDYYTLLAQVKRICRNYEFNILSILMQYADKLLSLLTKTLQGILCEVYSSLDKVNSIN